MKFLLEFLEKNSHDFINEFKDNAKNLLRKTLKLPNYIF